MSQKIRWITDSAFSLAILIVLQALTKGFGQLVTGSCVNGVLALCLLLCGVRCGITVALFSPVLAFLLGIAPQILTVPAIMVGNVVYILVLHFLAERKDTGLFRTILAWLSAAVAKFALLYAAVVWLICGVFSQALLSSGALKPPMLTALPATFTWPQLATALIGGGVALLAAPVLRKALHR